MGRSFLAILLLFASLPAQAEGLARAFSVSVRELSPELAAVLRRAEQEGAEAEPVAVGERSRGHYEVEGLFLESLPPDQDEASGFIWNRTEAAREVMREMHQAGVPILLSKLRPGLRAFVMPAAHRLGAPLLKHLHSEKQSYMLIQADSTKPELIHEFQHFKDFESSSFAAKFAELESALSEAGVSDEDLQLLFSAIREYRGYAAQERSLLADLASAHEVTNQRGEILSPGARAAGIKVQIQGVIQAYAIQEGAFYYVICRLRQSNVPAFKLLMESLEQFKLSGTVREIALPSRAAAGRYCR